MPLIAEVMLPIQVDYQCDWCRKGHMRPTGVMLTINPPLFPHKCDNNQCMRPMNLDRTYPFVEYQKKPKTKRRRYTPQN